MTEAQAAVFIRHGVRIMLVSSPGESSATGHRWGVPLVDIDDETTISEHVLDWLESIGGEPGTFIRSGQPIEVTHRHTSLVRTPILVEVVSTDLDVAAFGTVEWVQPPAILSRETTPSLWRLYESVAPTVRSISADTTHGSTYLSLRALEVLRDRAAGLTSHGETGDDELASLAKELRSARPDMVALKVRTALATREGTAAETVLERSMSLADEAEHADRHAARTVANEVGQVANVFVFSRSETVMHALSTIDPDRIITTVAHPGEEGIEVATELADRFDVILGPDAAFAELLSEAEVVLLGADGVDAKGRVTNKLGSFTLATVANAMSIPVYVVTATAKLCDDTPGPVERVHPGSIYDGRESIEVFTPRFDRTPAHLISGYCTERGVLGIGEVRRIAETHRALVSSS